ncbi:MAG TPA: GNAT family N-acetyltransferase [Flavobacteriales bacterium]|nr:GNAT family N-acetyltransferase [Flavobacteriales bacterium]
MHFPPYRLRPISANDGPALFALIDRNRARLEDFFAGTVAVTRTLADTEQHVKNMLARAEARTYYAFVLVHESSDELVGFVDIKNIDWNIPKAELGAFLDSHYEGQGIASKALEAITRHCFDTLALDKLLIRTHEGNTGARKVIERNGYQLEGTVRKDYRTTAGVVVDLMYYGKVR